MPIKKITRYANEDGFVFNHEPIEETLSIREKPDGYEARYLVIDEDPISPADINDAGLFLVAYHRQCTIKSHYISEKQYDRLRTDRLSLDEYERDWDEWESKYHIFPLQAYIHGGVFLFLNGDGNNPDSLWDLSPVGCVFVCKALWEDCTGAKDAARSLVDEWNSYLAGDIYGCALDTYDQKKKPIDQHIYWGYYRHDHAMKELENLHLACEIT